MTTPTLHKSLSALGQAAAHPAALLATAAFVAAWWRVEPETLDWHAAATIVTLVMAILIERNQTKDTRALQAKLDELIHATAGARDELAELEEQEPKVAEKVVRETPEPREKGGLARTPYYLDA